MALYKTSHLPNDPQVNCNQNISSILIYHTMYRMTIKSNARPSIYRAFRSNCASNSTAHNPSTRKHSESEGTEAPKTQDFKENEEHLKNLSKGQEKEHVERNFKGYSGLQEKGEKTPTEQQRPEDYM